MLLALLTILIFVATVVWSAIQVSLHLLDLFYLPRWLVWGLVLAVMTWLVQER